MYFPMTHVFRRPSILLLSFAAMIASTHASSSAFAKSQPRRGPASAASQKQYTAAELFKRYKPAVAKIVIKQQNIPVSIGAGFFVSGDGVLVTNHHVMRSAISNPGFSVEFILGDGTVVKDYSVSNCGDSRLLDVCLLKLKVKPKSFFTPTAVTPSPGETIYAIGHPRNLDFSISNGIVSAVRKSPTGVDEVQISAAISPGNSGGPIFNAKGELIGIASKYLKDGQNLNFGVLSSELARYVAQNKKFYPVATANRLINARVRKEMAAKAKDTLKPALGLALRGKPFTNTKGFKEAQLDFGDVSLKIQLPDLFENCVKANSEGDSIVHACFGMNENVVFSVQRFHLKDRGLLLKMNRKPLLEPKPLSVVEGMMQEGVWKEHERKLTPQQRQSFFSKPTSAQCQRLRANPLPNAYFSVAPACRFSVRGDTEPEAVSISVWLEKDSYLYGFNVWMNDPALGAYFNLVPTIAVLTASTEAKGIPARLRADATKTTNRGIASSAANNGPNSFAIDLPPALKFQETQVRPDGTKYNLYVKRGLIGRADDDYLLVVGEIEKGIQPVEFEQAARGLFDAMAQYLKFKPRKGSVEVEDATLDRMPGRLTSGFGVFRGQDILVLSVLGFDPSKTYMILQISDAKNPGQKFKDFKSLYSSFKRK